MKQNDGYEPQGKDEVRCDPSFYLVIENFPADFCVGKHNARPNPCNCRKMGIPYRHKHVAHVPVVPSRVSAGGTRIKKFLFDITYNRYSCKNSSLIRQLSTKDEE
jgi:hypothetical protein